MNDYRLDLATRHFEKFIDDLSNFYLRRRRERLKEDPVARESLAFILNEFSKVIAPFMPFLAERIYRTVEIRNQIKKKSVHLESWPKEFQVPDYFTANNDSFEEIFLTKEQQKKILEEIDEVRSLITELQMLRQKNNIPVRQTLSSATVKSKLEKEILEKYFEIIKDELNIKEIILGNENSLDLNMTSELKREGEQRELSRNIKDKRKELNLVSNDEIILTITEDKKYLLDGEYLKDMKVKEVKLGDAISIEKFN